MAWRPDAQLGIARSYHDQELYEEAEKEYQRALALFQQVNDANGAGDIWECLAELADDRDDPELAIRHCQAAAEHYAQAGNQAAVARVMLKSGALLSASNQLRKALKAFQSARDAAVRAGATDLPA